ncbi:MAG: hypothetical protein QW561_01135 [Candidatus Aenigmatarchaeota archaeon]
MDIKYYKFHISKRKDKDILEKIEDIPRPLRSEFIRAAIRFYIKHFSFNFTGPSHVDTPGKITKDVFGFSDEIHTES